MARTRATTRRPPRTIIGATSVVVVVALLTTLAVTAEGYDAQETPRLDASVWVTRDDGKYARVNTDLGEIDTVRAAEDPSNVIQSGKNAFVLTSSERLIWPIDAANPVDLTSAAAASDGEEDPEAGEDDSQPSAASLNTPGGTRDVTIGGDWVLFRTDANAVYLGTIADPSASQKLDPYAPEDGEEEPEEDAPTYEATAASVSASGRVLLYSSAEQSIRAFDANTREFTGDPVAVPSPPADTVAVTLAVIGDHWVLSDATGGRAWYDGGSGPVDTDLAASTVLQTSSDTGNVAYLADANELVSLNLETGAIDRLLETTGTPARPVVIDGAAYAAWITTDAGTLWSSATNESTPLQVADDELDDAQALEPVFRSNGKRGVLSETASGMLWTIPDGTLIPMEQWNLDDTTIDEGTVDVDDVAEQEPPVAVADSFGVRRGQIVRLPLLLNDHDPNKKDVLSVDAGSLSAVDNPAFGSVGLVSNNQEAVIKVEASSGSATFSYAVTDGTETSPPVAVTVTVVPDGQNTAPVWCGVEGCVQEWPTPQVAPGGIITVPVLTGWVDPEGDPIIITDARKDRADDPVTVVPKADGSVTIRHQDPNAAGGTVPISITVSDAYGASTVRTLELTVTASPALAVAPVALVAGVGEKTSVTVADHVLGGSGSYRLVDATTTAAGLLVVPNTAAGTIELSATEVGEYSLNYTVQDAETLAEQTALIRVSVVGGDAPLTMAPLTTFVRANEDTTVDVLGAVQNSTGRVLLVESAISGDPNLSVNVVAQSSVRVSGGTDSGLPGRIGTAVITVTDGAGASVDGTLTVFLAPPSTGVGPIAVPDAVTVRAGGQVDIPVTANDVSPRGERLLLLPVLEGAKDKGDLAFVTGDTVRYLAPQKAGTYTVRYSVYLGAEPSRVDTAAITITVVASGPNRDPQPPILTARVLSGQTVSIPVDGYGMDPDGDPVVLTAVSQPKAGQGVASISADGTAIVYTAPGNGISGSQVNFGYTVRDSNDAQAEGAVRVGVLNTEAADSAPIAYSDYIRTQIDSSTSVTVSPLLNDSDPADGKLELVELRPNTPQVDTNPEFARLESLIEDVDLKTGVVKLRAGSVLGTHSYVYTVASGSNNANGLIVVTVAEAGAPDHPEVTDTVITARNRAQLARGIDVVSGKVQWPTGDVSKLKLSLWGNQSGYSASGTKITGTLPRNGAIVPFSLSGNDSLGNKVVSYGFLRIPALDDMRLQLRSALAPITVGEEKSVGFDVLDVLDLDSSDTVEVRKESSYTVQRANSDCTPNGTTKATYTAGREAPWADYCAIPVRLDGQSSWTMLAVPITIEPKDPLAQLSNISRTVAPGAKDSVNLYEDMTSWQGGRVDPNADLVYSAVYSGSAFVVVHDPQTNTVSIETRATAKPGTREKIPVTVAAYDGLQAYITLVVGIAAPDTPRGATFTHQCDVRNGGSCAIQVIGQAGQYDPFASAIDGGLTLDSIGAGSAVSCPVASITMSGERIIATYPAGPKPAGGECIVPYTVKDAQGRVGNGQLTIDILGYPQRPASVTTTNFSGNSVTLTVALGEAANAHPSVTGVTIWEGATKVVANCYFTGAASYDCVVGGLTNGEIHTYTARAVNAVGESLDTTGVATSAYQPPNISNFTATAVYENGVTSTTVARVALSITSDSDTLKFRVLNNNQEILRTDDVTTATISIPPGSGPINIVPVSRFNPPNGSSNTGAQRTANVTPVGLPFFQSSPALAVTAITKTQLSVTAPNLNGNPIAGTTHYVAWKSGSAAGDCTVNPATGEIVITGGAVVTTSSVFTVPEAFTSYKVLVCGSNGFGVAKVGPIDAYAGVLPDPPPYGTSYRIRTNPDYDAATGRYTYPKQSDPNVGASSDGDFSTYFIINGSVQPAFTISDSANPTPVSVMYCATSAPTFCTQDRPVNQQTGNTISWVQFPISTTEAPISCIADADINEGRIQISSGSTGWDKHLDYGGNPLTGYTIRFRVTWNNGLESRSSDTFDIC